MASLCDSWRRVPFANSAKICELSDSEGRGCLSVPSVEWSVWTERKSDWLHTGARLLTGHLQAKGERFAGLVTTAASEDIQRGADGLVAVTATLLLIYARESDQDARDAMAEAALGIEEGTDTQEFADVVRLILEVNEGVVAPQAVQANAEAVGGCR